MTQFTKTTRRMTRWCLIGACCLALSSAVWAINPERWTHTTEADFISGQNQRVVVTNLGDVKLAMASEEIGQITQQASVIYDLQATANGDLYIAAGPEGKLLRRRELNIQPVLQLDGEQIFALDLLADGRLLVALSGAESSRLAALDDKDQLQTLQELPGVRYVWDLSVQGQTVDVATGTEGKLFRVHLDRAADGAEPRLVELFDANQANLLCLARDKQGRIYAGTDTDGLIYRASVQANGTVDLFVVYDAAEPEIGALLVLEDGAVYAGTADAQQARPGRLEKAVSAEGGRPGAPALEPEVEQPPQVPPQPEPIGGAGEQSQQQAQEADAEPAAPGDAQKEPADAQEEPVAPQITWPQQPQSLQTAPPSAPPAAESPQQPTPQQLDELRQVIRQRLDTAKQTGTLQSGPRHPAVSRARAAGRPASSARSQQGQPPKQGNAVYRISPDGFVSEVFRESVMILRLVDDGRGGLIVATGNEGEIFHLNPQAEEVTIVADLEPQQAAAVLQGPDGELLVGTANPASLVRLTPGFAQNGDYTSAVLDATQVSLWGKLNVTATVPQGATLSVQTRSGNVEDPEQAAWSPWSAPQDLPVTQGKPLTPQSLSVQSPPARFMQYRLNFTSDGQSTAVVDEVELAYVVPNLRPAIASITVGEAQPGGAAAGARPAPRPQPRPAGAAPGDDVPEPVSKLPIQWEASDPNNDRLRFTLHYQMEGSNRWLPLAKDLDQNRHEWETRRVPDGRYVVRVTASDAPDNPPGMAATVSRNSDPVLVDNTPPAFEGLAARVANGGLVVSATVADRLSAVRGVEIVVDDTEQWQPVLPDDLVYDSTAEKVSVTIPGLAPGQHVVTLRVRDQQNNARYEALVVDVPRP